MYRNLKRIILSFNITYTFQIDSVHGVLSENKSFSDNKCFQIQFY